jgi:hypothetical protein
METLAGNPLGFAHTERSREMDEFTEWLKHCHPGEAVRVTNSLVVDEHQFTGLKIPAKAQEPYGIAQMSGVEKL